VNSIAGKHRVFWSELCLSMADQSWARFYNKQSYILTLKGKLSRCPVVFLMNLTFQLGTVGPLLIGHTHHADRWSA
jgi:hypothetical protein